MRDKYLSNLNYITQDIDDTASMIEEFMTKHQGDTDKVQYITKKEKKL